MLGNISNIVNVHLKTIPPKIHKFSNISRRFAINKPAKELYINDKNNIVKFQSILALASVPGFVSSKSNLGISIINKVK